MSAASRPIQSCFQCRKRKIKCNRSYPCAPCILRGENDTCREVDKSTDGSSSRTTAETIDELLHRVSTLESIVSQLSDASKLSHPTPPAAPSHEPSIIRSSFGTDTKDEDVAMMLEDFAMGHRVNTNRAAQELEAASHSTVRSPQLRVTRKGPQLGILPSHPLALLIDPNTDILGRLLSVMLPEQQAGVLVQFYFDRLDWYSKVLHRPTFVAESKNLWANISSRNFAAIDIGFLAVYYMVLCLALHLIESIVREQLGLSFLAASDLARDMHSAAQACLHFDEFLGSHSLEHLQCIILMGVYQQNLDESDTHWALLGAAIKIAQNLGISMLGTEGEERTYSTPWGSIVRREVARRVWWILIWDDWLVNRYSEETPW